MNFEDFKLKYQKKEVNHFVNKVDSKVKVSVCVQTFQHVNYIKECLDGILKQKTTFPFEILLGEDNSTDGTREICIDYAQKYPEKIKLFLHHRENNIKINDKSSGRFNFLYNLYSTQGKYVALCEGDDYWIDPHKLQKQMDFLEKNKNYSLTVSNAFTNLKDIQVIYNTRKEGDFSCKDILLGNFIPTASIVFSKESLIFPKIIFESPAADWILTTYLLINKKGYYFNDPLVFYRVHKGGVWSSLKLKNDIDIVIKNAKMFFSNYNIFSKMKRDPLFNKKELQIIEKKRNSNGYQYNRLLLINSKNKEGLNRIPLSNFNLATIVKLLILRLKVYKI